MLKQHELKEFAIFHLLILE